MVYENFNAAAADITLTGVTAHPMSGKGVLVNPLLMASDFINHFDRQQTPEHTAGHEGYIWFYDLHANTSVAHLKAGIRDFDLSGFARRNSKLSRWPRKSGWRIQRLRLR